jgi:hypothetical protein
MSSSLFLEQKMQFDHLLRKIYTNYKKKKKQL